MAKLKDSFTGSGAVILAEKIKQFWTDAGYPLIQVTVRKMRGFPDMYQVRSNLGPDGYPPGEVA